MRIAVIQMNSVPDVDKNLEKIRSYIAGSAENGADLVVFPEAAMFPFDAGRLDVIAQPLDGPFARAVSLRLSALSMKSANSGTGSGEDHSPFSHAL